MGDVISSHLDEAKREIITGEERSVEVSLEVCYFGVLARAFFFFYAAVTDIADGLYTVKEK